MSGLALIAKALGARVTGSDRAESSYTQRLRHHGIEPVIGHAAKNVPDGAEVVCSMVPDGPEVTAAIDSPRWSWIAAAFSMFQRTTPVDRLTVRISSGLASSPASRRTDGMSFIVSSRPSSPWTM